MLARAVPALPVLPGRVAEGRVRVVGRPAVSAAIGVFRGVVAGAAAAADGGCALAPACAVGVVGAALGGVGEDLVRLHDKPVAFEAFDARERCGVDGAVRVVDLHELIEFVLCVYCICGEVEDLVRCWEKGRGGGCGGIGGGVGFGVAAGPVEVVSEVWGGAGADACIGSC